jgi:hypothetical protein
MGLGYEQFGFGMDEAQREAQFAKYGTTQRHADMINQMWAAKHKRDTDLAKGIGGAVTGGASTAIGAAL